MLDNFDTVNHNETALQLRREAAIHQRMGGIDMASRHVDYESSTDFGSITSIPVSELPGYYSSQPPDDNYESSDYRVSDLGGHSFCESVRFWLSL